MTGSFVGDSLERSKRRNKKTGKKVRRESRKRWRGAALSVQTVMCGSTGQCRSATPAAPGAGKEERRWGNRVSFWGFVSKWDGQTWLEIRKEIRTLKNETQSSARLEPDLLNPSPKPCHWTMVTIWLWPESSPGIKNTTWEMSRCGVVWWDVVDLRLEDLKSGPVSSKVSVMIDKLLYWPYALRDACYKSLVFKHLITESKKQDRQWLSRFLGLL